MKDLKTINNLVIVSLDDNFSKAVAQTLANQLDMFGCDVKELIIYDLINPEEILEKCGYEYLKKREKGVVRSSADYQNTVISVSFDLYKEYSEEFTMSLIIYLQLQKTSIRTTASKIAYQSRDEFLKDKADIVLMLDRKSKNSACKGIVEKLGGLL